ncbi:Heterokaryon incompatibility [Metarhizium guizhouense ARSEF 977]|uniref:Heterokaryon incompatibility n=1 Tax=Metarhizium guizhouense (strain ARSEF 977) TaxID=1276136 RepID=A0A0B4GQQ0_METGA|nr:Heterokaryon incompatibility [Metarhizium guizhouense ARSEF 977]
MDNDDKNSSLFQISLRNRAPIVSQLVNVGSELNQREHAKFRSFITNLQCLRPKGNRLHRESINAFRQRRYVALSYTWKPSEYEDKQPGPYSVQSWDGNGFQRSEVRKCVFDRILHYMNCTDICILWMDAHSIPQNTCGVDYCTGHAHCAQKRNAIQAMDLVYQLSEHPVALLGWQLTVESELHLLTRILSGDLVSGISNREFRLSKATSIYEAKKALWLLWKITHDLWWERAWTFQENYRSGSRMRLLIRHNPSLESQKLRYHLFGKIPGELCISSVAFSAQVTQLCLAIRGAAESMRLNDLRRIDNILQAAGRYALILPESSCMTPTVIADIETRGLTQPWDRLALIANCCQYPVRLDSEVLCRRSQSLSLSILAMCLLNGEILNNSNDDTTSVAGLTTSVFLKRLIFRGFGAPEDDNRPLTFNKGCRLTDVELTACGVVVKGHLWKLGRVIDTSTFWPKLPWIAEPRGRLTLWQRKRLLQLVFRLHDLDHDWLAERIDGYLAADANTRKDYRSFTEMYVHRMAVEIAATIQSRQKLRLGSIWDAGGCSSPYRAIFAWTGEDTEMTCQPPPAYVFTCARQGDPGSYGHDANDIDRHVSLQVELNVPLGSCSLPQLRIRRWLLGICFFDECPRTRMVFPWPRVLHAVKP